MTPRKARESRENFEQGKAIGWTAGAYGHTARVFVERGKIKIRHQKPSGGKRQRTLFVADTPALRKKATAVAVSVSEKLRARLQHQAEQEAKPAEEVTIYDVVLLYLRRAPGFPEEILSGGPTQYGKGISGQVNTWYRALPASVRQSATTPKAKTLWTDCYAFFRLWRDPRFARTRRVMDLEPGDATAYAAEAPSAEVMRTRVNDTDRLSCAIRYVLQQHRKSVGIPYNPIEGRIVDRSKADIDAYEPEERDRMLAALRKGEPGPSSWQIRFIFGAASSGRRISSILALTAADHDLEAGTVTWRAEAAKGEGYGRGDETLPMTDLHRQALEWVLEHHPNPLGPEAPIVYTADEPGAPVKAPLADKQLKRLEAKAGVPHVPGRAFHGFCRLAITTAAEMFGDELASEFTGRKPETIRRYGYKKVVHASMKKVAKGLGKRRKDGEDE